jgi:hypothetical protein
MKHKFGIFEPLSYLQEVRNLIRLFLTLIKLKLDMFEPFS